jgi:hypothetical protein
MYNTKQKQFGRRTDTFLKCLLEVIFVVASVLIDVSSTSRVIGSISVFIIVPKGWMVG